MDKGKIKKNQLDLEYHKLTQLFSSVLVISLTGSLGFLGSFTFLLEDKNKLAIGLSISAVILIIIYGWGVRKLFRKKYIKNCVSRWKLTTNF